MRDRAPEPLVHYVGDRDQPNQTLCGRPNHGEAVWKRAEVTCPTCADIFDQSLLALRRRWNREKRRRG